MLTVFVFCLGIPSQPPVPADLNQGPWMTPEFPTQLLAMQPPHLHLSKTNPVHKPMFQIYPPAQYPVPPTVPILQPLLSSGGFQEMHPEELPLIPPIEPSLLPYHTQSLLPHPAVPPWRQSEIQPVVSSTAAYQVEASTAAASFHQPSTLHGPFDALWTTNSATSPHTTYSDKPPWGK